MDIAQTPQRVRSSARMAAPSGPTASLNRDLIELEAIDLTLQGQPGEQVTQTLRITNHASVVDPSDPDYCNAGTGDGGVGVEVPATIQQPIGEQDVEAFCLAAGESREVQLTFTLPTDPGEYTIAFTPRNPQNPQVWGNITETLVVGSGGGTGGDGGTGGGGGDGQLFMAAGAGLVLAIIAISLLGA